MKNQFKTILLLLLALFISSCKQNAKYTIGFMVPNYKESRYAIDRDNFIEKVKQYNCDVLVENADNDDRLQIEQAENLMKQGVDALVIIAVNQNTAASIVREAKKKGIIVVAYERLIRNCELDFFVTYDHYIVGQEMAKYVLRVKPEGNYIIIGGDKSDKNAELIESGCMELLSPYINSKKINIIFNTFIDDWDSELAYVTMKRILKTSNIMPDVIISANDGMAGGIIEALDEYSLAGKVIVSGLDAELDACRRIVKGKQTFTVYKPLKNQAYIAADVTYKLLTNEKIKEECTVVNNGKIDVPTYAIKPIVVDINNIRQTIIADGFQNEKEIFKK